VNDDIAPRGIADSELDVRFGSLARIAKPGPCPLYRKNRHSAGWLNAESKINPINVLRRLMWS
jgi:hypothetical protein